MDDLCYLKELFINEFQMVNGINLTHTDNVFEVKQRAALLMSSRSVSLRKKINKYIRCVNWHQIYKLHLTL